MSLISDSKCIGSMKTSCCSSKSEFSLPKQPPTTIPADTTSAHSILSSPGKSQLHQTSNVPKLCYDKGAIGDGEFQPNKSIGGQIEKVSSEDFSAMSMKSTTCQSETETQVNFTDPVFRKLSRLNGEINRMHKEELRQKLSELHLHTGGVKEVLKKRLKNFYRRKKLKAANVKDGAVEMPYDYLVIIDFEATCQDNNDLFVHEIIEFPAVLVDVKEREIVGIFREFCRPTLNPVLSEFCKELTGVNQSEVENASEFPAVLQRFEEWMQVKGLGSSHSFAIVTDGPWDIQRFLSKQCELCRLPLPRWARTWVNLRKAFCNFYDCKRLNLANMLLNLGLTFQGRPHCGLDDSKNIACIVCHLLADGCVIKPNEVLDGRSNLPKPSRFSDTGDGTHSAGFKPKSAAVPKKEKSVKEMSGLETDEELSDLLFYFQLQSS